MLLTLSWTHVRFQLNNIVTAEAEYVVIKQFWVC